MPKISIVTAYYNRRDSLIRTLKVMEKSSFKDFEFIIIDDGSDWRQRIEDVAEQFSFVRLKRIEPKDKTHINPCIPFNMGFSMARGDIIIIQNPECLHVGDVIDYVSKNSIENQYLVFSCYSLSDATTQKLAKAFNLSMIDIESAIRLAINFRPISCDSGPRFDSWFVHPKLRKVYYNFLTALTRKDLLDLGGFDERFANGVSYDDTDFVARILKKKMDAKIIEYPFCLHQYHTTALQCNAENEKTNKKIYEDLLKSPHYKVRNSFMESHEQ
jgi:glycosyltransferase involved in cell wall biosynthesis